MAEDDASSDIQAQTDTSPAAAAPDLRQQLLDAGMLRASREPGLYARAAAFERIVRAVGDLVVNAATGAEEPCWYFPPVISRSDLEATDYHRSFPNLMGLINSFSGGESDYRALLSRIDAGAGWTDRLSDSGLALCSAACHSLYPQLSGQTFETGRRFEVEATCFRHEPSADPGRMQSFRMHEYVFVGTPADALAFREEWLARARELLVGLGLTIQIAPANDPFFGRAGGLLASGQREAGLKFELIAPVDGPTAIGSANYHEDHFGSCFGLALGDGRPAHSACVAFGLDRTALALCQAFGPEVSDWPAATRAALRL